MCEIQMPTRRLTPADTEHIKYAGGGKHNAHLIHVRETNTPRSATNNGCQYPVIGNNCFC